ncbi:MAG: glycosyltransferase [Micromonosporaceae bacterium]|nr:glycosyltransferase [Micromonosporaceae bacterium]
MSTAGLETGAVATVEHHSSGRFTLTLACTGVAVVCLLVAWHVWVRLTFFRGDFVMALYTVVVSVYVLSRFVLAAFYRLPEDRGFQPTVAIIVPAYNEGVGVSRTIHSCMALDYPAEKVELVVVNDGSCDDTLDYMTSAAAHYANGRVRCIDLGSNQGKRAAMAAGIRNTSAEILVFIDSDSTPAPDAIGRLVQGFAQDDVGAISGITYVRNAVRNTLTRMQAVRYVISFDLLKRAESVLGAVTCCSGCFAAYRRASVIEVLSGWERQRFLGVECTYGDDRALTNRVLRAGWQTRYDASAVAWTEAPTTYRGFLKQQARWKKSWAREGPLLLCHIWRSRTRALPSIAAQTLAGVLSPIIVLYMIATSVTAGRIATVYLIGLGLIASAYCLLYRMLRNDDLWPYALLGAVLYVLISPQLIWSALRIRDGSWGTRTVRAGGADPSSSDPDGSAPSIPRPLDRISGRQATMVGGGART